LNLVVEQLDHNVFPTDKTAAYIGFAARLAGRWSNGHFMSRPEIG